MLTTKLRRTFAAVTTAMALAIGGAVAVASPAFADTTPCSGFANCATQGYTDHGYQANMGNQYWGAYAGDNCTNYAAFVQQTVNGAPTPSYQLGNADTWYANAGAHGVLTNATPARGAVAWWGDANWNSYSGHVANVEVVYRDGSIDVSWDSYPSGPFVWRHLAPTDTMWPDGFIHFKDLPQPVTTHVAGDFNGDGRSDLAVFRPGNGTWYVQSPGIYSAIVQWGQSGDIPVPADYNGDGTTDYALWRPSNQTWYINSPGVFSQVTQWGLPGDIPVPGDYNGDGKAELAVYRPSEGNWYINGMGVYQWGQPGDIPVAADFNGDGRDDLALYRPSNGTWYVLSPGIYNTVYQWGFAEDIPVPGNYNGAAYASYGNWRPSNQTWYILRVGVYSQVTQWGVSGDVPVRGDFTGDGAADPTVYRPSNGTWYVQTNSQATQWGSPTDLPAVTVLPAPLLQQYGLIASY